VVALLHGTAGDLGVGDRSTDDAHDRRLPAEHLLDRGRDELGILDDLAAVVGVLGQVGEHAVEGGGDGVEAGDEEQEADVEDLVAGQAHAVDLGGEELAEQVVLLGAVFSSSTSSK
jgi:hypothetical protein